VDDSKEVNVLISASCDFTSEFFKGAKKYIFRSETSLMEGAPGGGSESAKYKELKMKVNPTIFREYDVRGVVNKEFDTEFAYHLGRAIGTTVRRKFSSDFASDSPDKRFHRTVAVGRDARLSSLELAQVVVRGLSDCGLDVIDLGLVTTPITYFATFNLSGLMGAVMITGSHNPPEYNGFKVSVGKETIFGEQIQALKVLIENEDYETGKGSVRPFDIFPMYVEKYKREFAGLKSLPVVLDCGNGVAGCIARKLYESVGLNPVILFEEPDGTFPNHHPDPTVEKNLKDLKEAVAKNKAVVGIGFDGDCDRIGVVDENGRMVFGDELIVMISRAILEDSPGQKIIGDVKCSDRLFEDIRSRGGHAIMWKTGHSLIKKKIKDEKAPFGGEMSGHIFFNDRNDGYDDALYAGLRLIEILAKKNTTPSRLLDGFPPAYNTPELRIDTTEEKKVSIVEGLRQKYANPSSEVGVNLIDGIRVSFKDGWALARASNTQPVLVLRFESTTPEGLTRIRNEFESYVNQFL